MKYKSDGDVPQAGGSELPSLPTGLAVRLRGLGGEPGVCRNIGGKSPQTLNMRGNLLRL